MEFQTINLFGDKRHNEVKWITQRLVFNYNPKIPKVCIFWGNKIRLHKLMTLDKINREGSVLIQKIMENDSLYHDPFDKKIELDLFN
jgi:hypothetical protein